MRDTGSFVLYQADRGEPGGGSRRLSDRRSWGAEEAERERRRIIRHNCRAVVEMDTGYAAGASQNWSVESIKTKGRVLDLSTIGAALFTREPFEVDQDVRITIKVKNGSKIMTNGSIRWVRPIPEKDGHAFGVQFTDIDTDDRMKIRKFLAQLDATLGL